MARLDDEEIGFGDKEPEDLFDDESTEDIENYIDEDADPEDYEVEEPNVHGFVWFLPRRKWYQMQLENEHLRKCVRCLQARLNASSNRYLMRKAQQKYTRFDNLYRQYLRVEARNEILQESLDMKDEIIEELKRERDYLRDQLEKAMTANVVKDAESKQFQSADGISGKDKQILCYWLNEDGKDIAYIKKHLHLTNDKTVSNYINKGKSILSKKYATITVDTDYGTGHKDIPFTDINIDGTWKEDSTKAVNGFECPLTEFYSALEED